MNRRVLPTSASAFLLRDAIKLDDLDEQARRRVQAAQIDGVVQLMPLTMTVNVFNAAIIVYLFWDLRNAAFLIGWGALVVAEAAGGFWSWGQTRKNRPTGASARAIKRMILHAAFLGVTWGAAPLMLFPEADTMHQLFLSALMAGMISGGAFCLSTVPMAGLIYTWMIVAGSVTALLLAGYSVFFYTAVVLVIYALFISRNLVTHGTQFVGHVRAQMRVEAQSKVIGLLLNDFQEHASDWLWETDANGILMNVSDRFAEAARKMPSEIQGMRLSDLVGGKEEYRPPELADILKRMAERTAFRDIALPVQFGAKRHFWLLSGKPVFNNAGAFTGYHGAGADVTEKRLADERIVRLARYDTLTELPNRTSFQEEIGRVLNEARANSQSVALLCLDLDQFKSVNDTLGHSVGDALLKLVGKRIKSCVRDRDIVARLGGDEFAILQLFPDLPTGSIVLARLILDAFKEPFKLDHGDIVIDASLGISVVPADGWDADSLMKKADLALYAAKAAGAATYRFFEPEMEAWAHRRRALEVGLRSALKNGEIRVVFQPLIDLGSWKVAGCEALARWTSPEWGVVSPAEFIPVAEATGLIETIGEWVMREATKEARRWPDDTIISVNLSPVQFKSQKLLATVVAALADSGLSPHRLELEMTESIFLGNGDQVQEMLKNLRTLGVRTSLDDFGTGYSSLSYLRRFPFDKIKIDKSFIDDVAAHDESLAIIRAIVALANALGMSTTAEGVESAGQVARLRKAGCTQIQGYIFSPPRPAEEIIAMFESRLEGAENGSVVARARAG